MVVVEVGEMEAALAPKLLLPCLKHEVLMPRLSRTACIATSGEVLCQIRRMVWLKDTPKARKINARAQQCSFTGSNDGPSRYHRSVGSGNLRHIEPAGTVPTLVSQPLV